MDVLVLDLDGTLVDTLDDLADAFAPVLAARSLAPITARDVGSMIGDGLPALVARAFALRGAVAGPDDQAAYAQSYGRLSGRRSRLYPGAADALEQAASDGWTLAVCTNKPEGPARALLERLGVAGRFAAICGGDSFAVRKPDPGHVTRTIEAAGGEPARAVMVGDLTHDVVAARDASVRSIWVSWGYGSPDAAVLATGAAEHWAEIPALASGLLGRP